jgi:pre-rRNA-processing protein TSR1
LPDSAESADTSLQGTEPGIVLPGSYVRLSLPSVPKAAAAVVCSRVSAYLMGSATPLTALGLQRHECKLSVVNFSVKKHAAYEEAVKNKEDVVFLTGLRSFRANPILSTDEYNASKFKMEKFMHPGRTYVMSVYAPISYPPLPVLVVKQVRRNRLVLFSKPSSNAMG